MKRSNHYGDIQKWIEKIIDSCQNIEQLNVAKRLVNVFGDKLNREGNYHHTNLHLTIILDHYISLKREELS